MITYIKGRITYISPTCIIVETGGVGYFINISLNTHAQIEGLESVKIWTHYHVKEDSHTLYGFAEESERRLFGHLISVSGIGPATAQSLLSFMNPAEVRAAIISEDVLAFKQVKGVGPKTAKQIILDLKDKMLKDSGDVPATIALASNTIRQEALSALLTLKMNKIQAQKVLNKILKEQPGIQNVEDLVRLALKDF